MLLPVPNQALHILVAVVIGGILGGLDYTLVNLSLYLRVASSASSQAL
jgi:hypothetical protein